MKLNPYTFRWVTSQTQELQYLIGRIILATSKVNPRKSPETFTPTELENMLRSFTASSNPIHWEAAADAMAQAGCLPPVEFKEATLWPL